MNTLRGVPHPAVSALCPLAAPSTSAQLQVIISRVHRRVRGCAAVKKATGITATTASRWSEQPEHDGGQIRRSVPAGVIMSWLVVTVDRRADRSGSDVISQLDHRHSRAAGAKRTSAP